MKIIICDDQISEIQKLETLCIRYFQEKEIAAEIETTMNPKEILAEPLEADILILDVEMGEVNGIEIKNELARRGNGPLVIFATNYPENMSRAFNVNVIGFLIKPVRFSDLSAYLDTGVNLIFANKHFTYPDGSRGCLDEILWITADSGYADVHLKDGNVKNIGKHRMKELAARLEPLGFICISSGQIINCKHISTFRDDRILLRGILEKPGGESCDREFSVSRRRKKECFEKYAAYCEKVQKYI
ncbi:MAG: LytTR family DNA-binding domain-containing protein [Emergencia sp.]|nr:LytTR family DNA-binding domain-containing protein [Emergencia sp.]